MKKVGIIAVLCCVFALSMALVGCGGSASDPKQAFIGTWELIEMNDNGTITSQEDLELLKSLGIEVTAELNEDGTASINMMGEAMTGTWEASSATAGKITIEGQSVDMTLDGDKLSMSQNNQTLTFQKATASSSASSAS